MAKNGIFTRLRFALKMAIAGKTSGDPAILGAGGLHGVCETTTDSAGNVMVDVGLSVYELSVKGIDGGGNSKVEEGDKIYYTEGDTPKLSKKATGTFFGYALEEVASGATDTINVLIVQ